LFATFLGLQSFLVRKKILHRQPRDTPQRTVSIADIFADGMMCEKHLRGIFLKWNPIANDELQERPPSLENTPTTIGLPRIFLNSILAQQRG